MDNKKHIDRIFQEQLKDFEVVPAPEVWQNIQEKLQQKKKRRIIPLWFRIGIAASILLLLGLGFNFFIGNTSSNDKIDIVNTLKKDKPTQETLTKSKNNSNNQTLIEENNSTFNNTQVTDNTKATNNKSIPSKKEETPITVKKIKVKQPVFVKNTQSEKRIFNQNNTPFKKDNVVENNQNLTKNIFNNKTSQAITNPSNTKIDKQQINTDLENKINNDIKNVVDNPLKTPLDSTKIEDVIANQEAITTTDNKTEENPLKRWSINPNIAPVYYNSLGTGSSIDEQFDNNSKTGEVNTSYGINVSYAINDKWSVRTGINKLNLSYDTDNVIIYDNIETNPNDALLRMPNILFTNAGVNIISANELSVFELNSVIGNRLNAALSQRLSYFEVPVEVEYALVNKKFGVQLIGGVSTFILNDNSIYSELSNVSTHIGEANNINTLSFSTNIGLGINYKFSEKFRFNLEPTFKYQLNAYNNTSGNFSPYIIGVYSGFSFKF